MDSQLATLMICATAAAYIYYKRYQNTAISDVPGPKNPSRIFGHEWWWQREEAGVIEKRLLDEYGAVVRWNGSLGEERLWVADPKAIHHILQGSGDLYERPFIVKEIAVVLTGGSRGKLEGDEHKRQRRTVSPAFGVETKALCPYFIRCSDTLADKWHGLISIEESGRTATIDVNLWLSKATLDAIGAAGFDYDFGALENSDNKLTKSYSNLVSDVFAPPSKGYLFMMDALRFSPKGSIAWLMERGKHPAAMRMLENRACVGEVATKLIHDRRQEMSLNGGTPQKDFLSLLVKANSTAGQDWRLSDEDLIAQIHGFVLAGHDSTAKTLSFTLWELAKNRQVQESLRAEIMDTLGRIKARGDDDLAADDFDSMPYLLAVVKETLRVHPVVNDMARVATKDDILPLAKPIVGVSGKVYNEIPVPAGTTTVVSIIGYNLSKAIWGPDAYEFRPERWLDMDQKRESPVGVYSNLATFSGGSFSCVGWRFGVIQIHTFLVTLIKQFEFSLPDDGHEAKGMKSSRFLVPIVVGEEHKGPQMPLKVTVLRNE